MKPLSALLLFTLLFTACEESPEKPESEYSFEEQAAHDAEIAQQRQEEAEAQEKVEEEQFAQMEPTDDDGDGYKTFIAQEFGVAFTYPSDWIFDLDRYGEDGYRVDLSNEKREDSCTPSVAQLTFTFPNPKDSTLSFEEFMNSPEMHEESVNMGKLGGVLTKMTLAGHAAFHADSSGYETIACEDEAYVVEMNDSEYLFIGLFTGTEGNEADEVQKILDSLQIQ